MSMSDLRAKVLAEQTKVQTEIRKLERQFRKLERMLLLIGDETKPGTPTKSRATYRKVHYEMKPLTLVQRAVETLVTPNKPQVTLSEIHRFINTEMTHAFKGRPIPKGTVSSKLSMLQRQGLIERVRLGVYTVQDKES